MFEQSMGKNCVKMTVFEWESVNACHLKRCISLLLLFGSVLSATDLPRLKIDSKGVPGRYYLG